MDNVTRVIDPLKRFQEIIQNSVGQHSRMLPDDIKREMKEGVFDAFASDCTMEAASHVLVNKSASDYLKDMGVSHQFGRSVRTYSAMVFMLTREEISEIATLIERLQKDSKHKLVKEVK